MLLRALFLLAAALPAAAGDPPRPLAVNPPPGAEEVPPGIGRIEVFFDRDMEEGSHSIVGAPDGDVPPLSAEPAWRNARAFLLPVAPLEAGKSFAFGLNSAKRQGFRSKEGAPLAPFAISFRTSADPAPVVESTEPPFGALDADPALDRITIRFNEEVNAGRMSLVRVEGGERLGYIEGRPPKFENARTLVIPVRLEPGTLYGVGVNGGSHRGFASARTGKPVLPYALLFRTRAASAPAAEAGASAFEGSWRGCDEGGDILLELRRDGTYSLRSGDGVAEGTWRAIEGGIEVRQSGGYEPLRVPCRVTPEGALEAELEGKRILLRRGAAAEAPGPRGGGEILHSRLEMVKTPGVEGEIPRHHLWCMNADGSDRRPIFQPDRMGEAREPWYLPDGSGFIFTGVFQQGRSACLQDVFLCSRDGTMRRLTGAEAPEEIPARGAGTIRGIWYDDTQRRPGERTTVTIYWWSGKGRWQDGGEVYGQRLFELHDVPAGKVWIRLFVEKHVGSLHVAEVVPGGTTEVRFLLTEGNWLAGRGSLTPDGRHLVYLSQLAYWDVKKNLQPRRSPHHDPESQPIPRAPEGAGYDTIAVLDRKGGAHPVALWDPTKMGGDFAKDPRLSNDGRFIAFARGLEPMQSLAVMSLASLLAGAPEVKSLVAPEAPAPGVGVGCSSPAWSPDGRRIAFLRYTMATGTIRGDLWIVDADGGNLRQLTRGGPNQIAHWPSWSPDGARIAFALVTGRGEHLSFESLGRLDFTSDVWTIGADGADPRRLTEDGRSGEPSWGP